MAGNIARARNAKLELSPLVTERENMKCCGFGTLSIVFPALNTIAAR